jgi:hypothetical protein
MVFYPSLLFLAGDYREDNRQSYAETEVAGIVYVSYCQ